MIHLLLKEVWCSFEKVNLGLLLNIIPCSTLIFNSLIITVRHKCSGTFPSTTSFLLTSLSIFFHIFTNTKSVHITSTYHHSWCSVFEFTLNVTYFHRVSDIQCMHLYFVHQTLINITCSVVDLWETTSWSFKTPGKTTDHLRRIYRIYLKFIQENQKDDTFVTGWSCLGTLGSGPSKLCPKISLHIVKNPHPNRQSHCRNCKNEGRLRNGLINCGQVSNLRRRVGAAIDRWARHFHFPPSPTPLSLALSLQPQKLGVQCRHKTCRRKGMDGIQSFHF